MSKSVAEIAGDIVVALFQNSPEVPVNDDIVAQASKAYETIYSAIVECESSSAK